MSVFLPIYLSAYFVWLSVRELALEQKLGIAHQVSEVDALIAQGSGSSGSSGNTATDDPSLAEIRQLTLAQAQARASETQLELDDARAQMNDLILEIDAVTVEDGKSREQSERLLRQMTESQSMQRGVLDENLRLHDQIAELHRKQGERRRDMYRYVTFHHHSPILFIRHR